VLGGASLKGEPSPFGSASCGLGWPNNSQRSRKCACAAERSVRSTLLHLAIKTSAVMCEQAAPQAGWFRAGSRAGMGLNVGTVRLYTRGAAASCSLATSKAEGSTQNRERPDKATPNHPQAGHKRDTSQLLLHYPRVALVLLWCSHRILIVLSSCFHRVLIVFHSCFPYLHPSDISRPPVSPPSPGLVFTVFVRRLFKLNRIFPIPLSDSPLWSRRDDTTLQSVHRLN